MAACSPAVLHNRGTDCKELSRGSQAIAYSRIAHLSTIERALHTVLASVYDGSVLASVLQAASGLAFCHGRGAGRPTRTVPPHVPSSAAHISLSAC